MLSISLIHTRDTSLVYQSSINVFSLQLCLHFIPLQSHVLSIGTHTHHHYFLVSCRDCLHLAFFIGSASLYDTCSVQSVSRLRSEVVLITTSGLNHNNINLDPVPFTHQTPQPCQFNVFNIKHW